MFHFILNYINLWQKAKSIENPKALDNFSFSIWNNIPVCFQLSGFPVSISIQMEKICTKAVLESQTTSLFALDKFNLTVKFTSNHWVIPIKWKMLVCCAIKGKLGGTMDKVRRRVRWNKCVLMVSLICQIQRNSLDKFTENHPCSPWFKKKIAAKRK